MEQLYSSMYCNITNTINICSVEFLASDKIEIPKFQRQDDEDHIQSIYLAYKDQYDKNKKIFVIGQIVLSSSLDNQKFQVIDGQHRIYALKKLFNKYPDIGNTKVNVSCYITENEDVKFDIYRKINSNKQVPYQSSLKSATIIKEIILYLQNNYKGYVKKSGNPHIPDFNIDKFEKEMKNRKICEKIEDSKTFINAMEKLNTFYKSRPCYDFKNWGLKKYQEVIEKIQSRTTLFYLGMYKRFEWIERIKNYIFDKVEFESISHNFSEDNTRITIPKFVRRAVWNKRNDNIIGKCFCCSDELTNDNFECAHVVALCMGGKNNVENLEPTCRKCNIDMGILNLHEYKNLINDAMR